MKCRARVHFSALAGHLHGLRNVTEIGMRCAEPWNGSWTRVPFIGCVVCIESTSPAAFVQPERPGRVVVGMVRRRSTVRFRKGAPRL
jgi:hypothetical protein